jgi:GntR family transcriptional regulator
MAVLLPLLGPLPQEAGTPLYARFQRLLRNGIQSGTLKAKQALPSERDLCDEYGISRITIRKAIAELVEEGWLIRIQGSGTFVSDGKTQRSERVEKNFSKLSSFSEDMRARGMQPSSRWLSRMEGTVTPNEGLALALSPGSRVYRYRRVRLADDRPMAIEYSTVPADCLPSIDAVTTSLYEALRQAGCEPVRALQRLRAAAFGAELTDELGVAAGHAGLLIERRAFLKDGRAVEFTLSHYRGDSYDFMAELSAG